MTIYTTQASLIRWRVPMKTRTKDGRAGEQSFIVEASGISEAEQLAWQQAHTPEAARKRRGAEITTRREELCAFSVEEPMFSAVPPWWRAAVR
jgi:hypothetical protein